MANPTSTMLRMLADGTALDTLRAGADVLQQAIIRNGGTPSESDCDWVADILRAMASAYEDELNRLRAQTPAAMVGNDGQEP
jgi:hypothetical protein